MSEAKIIPFPVRDPKSADRDRLARALTDLQGALAEQKRALSDWRFAMTELGIGVAGLGQSLVSYQDSLGEVESRLSGLRHESAKLTRTAEQM